MIDTILWLLGLGSTGTTKLSKPLKPLYPAFPRALEDKLPAGISYTDVDRHCVCPHHMPNVWESTADHPTLCSLESPEGENVPPLLQPLYRRCALGDMLQVLMANLDRLSTGTLTPKQDRAVKEFQGVFSEYQRLCIQQLFGKSPKDQLTYKHLPNLAVLGELLNVIFFQGLLHQVDYAWETHTPDGNCILSTRFGYTNTAHRGWVYVRVYPLTAWDNGQTPNVSPTDMAAHVVGTILHEQIHAFFRMYLCMGNCTGTDDQKALCWYLAFRQVKEYSQFEMDGKKWSDSSYLWGHGPAFQELARRLRVVAKDVLQLESPLTLGFIVRECSCDRPSSCLSHCYDDYSRQQWCLTWYIQRGHATQVK